jgi:diacylglycerol kinase
LNNSKTLRAIHVESSMRGHAVLSALKAYVSFYLNCSRFWALLLMVSCH